MAREIAATSKSSSLRFDGESDEEENTGSHGQSSKAVARPSNVAKDTSGLFVKDDEPIGFYVADKEISRSIVVRLEQQIGECGGEFLSKSPVEGYVLVDTRTEGGANYISSRSTATRRVVSYLFVQESISRGKIVPYSELILFIKEDRPVMFHLHKSLGEDESERLRDAIMLRGGNPDATLRTAQVLIHADDWPNKALIARKHQGIALFETVQWLEACIRTKRFSLSSRVGTIPKPVKAPGRKPGAPRTDYTPDDDKRLIGWMAHYFGKSMVGRAGNRPYQLMTEHPQCASWAHRHTWQSWRERYKNRKSHFDPLIEAHLAKHPAVKPNDAESFVVDDELDTDDELETGDDESDTDDSGTPGPAPRPKRKTRDSSSTPGRSSGPKAPEGKETRPSKKAKTIRPAPKKVQEDEEEAEEEEDGEEEEEPVVQTKVSASQRAAKSQHPQPNKKGKASPTPEQGDDDHEDIQSKYFTSQRPSKLHPPPTPPLGPPPFSPAEQGSHRRESGPGLPLQDASDPVGVDDSLDESQDSIQMTPPFGILEISANVQDEVNRLNAELATVEQQPQISDEEVDELEDPDVDVVGVTQVETPPGSPMVRDEDGYEGTPEDAGGTEIENLSIQLHQLADEFSVSLDRVKSAYEAIAPDLDEREALDSIRRELKKSRKARRGKGWSK